MAGAYFLLYGKGPEYRLPLSLNSLKVIEAYEQLVSRTKKYCGEDSLRAFDAAKGANWNEVAKFVIEANYLNRSPYDQRLLKKDLIDFKI